MQGCICEIFPSQNGAKGEVTGVVGHRKRKALEKVTFLFFFSYMHIDFNQRDRHSHTASFI